MSGVTIQPFYSTKERVFLVLSDNLEALLIIVIRKKHFYTY